MNPIQATRRTLFATVLIAMLLTAPVAGAHVTLQPTKLEPGGFARLDVRVPNERDKADTTKVEVQFPPGFFFLNYEPKPGWTIKVTREKLARPAEVFGQKITEQVKLVSITSRDRREGIAPGQFLDFGLSGGPVPGKPGQTLTFKALQTYSNGEIVRWIAPDPEAETPAARVTLVSDRPPAPAAAATDGDDDSSTLAVIALVVGGLGLLAALAALATTRRRSGVAA
jgi:uncharacterized protein YcnI